MYFVVLFALIGACVAAPAPEEAVPIVSQSSDVQPDGSYNFSYQTGDGTAVEQHGSVRKIENEDSIVAEGKYSYKGPDGVEYVVTYTADENGFKPSGDHIPAVPAAIARALEYIAAHPEENEPKKA
ncbi:endocuticle structural glycoprotein SgAbd-4-like [Onthophagus taurus]|uniref:endocuticle structural glycoprotein SgAbd-4-like n=1 Tax=Onthophagus taurus TaxID=166361 RepID=UPI000C20D7D3|nr:endocuticle structural glycoprotein SgAbd-4-like [Onthophagus taurus]